VGSKLRHDFLSRAAQGPGRDGVVIAACGENGSQITVFPGTLSELTGGDVEKAEFSKIIRALATSLARLAARQDERSDCERERQHGTDLEDRGRSVRCSPRDRLLN